MKLVARAPIDDFDGTGDKRPGDTFDCKDEDIAVGLIEVGDAEPMDVEVGKKAKESKVARKVAKDAAAAEQAAKDAADSATKGEGA